MTEVQAAIDIAAPPSVVWRVVMDPQRLSDWVTIHRKLHKADPFPPFEGAHMEQTLALRGTPFKVRWTLTKCEPETHAVWHGKGPAASKAETEYALSPTENGQGTRFAYRNSFKAPFGPLGAVASRAMVGDLPRREADASLSRLRELCENAAR